MYHFDFEATLHIHIAKPNRFKVIRLLQFLVLRINTILHMHARWVGFKIY